MRTLFNLAAPQCGYVTFVLFLALVTLLYPVPAAPIRPVLRPDVAAQLERVGIQDLVRRGSVQLIGLEPIRAQLGERWPKKCEHIWRHFESVLLRQLPPHDLVVQIDEFHFLIAQTQEQGASAQAICLRLAAELMRFFLGSASDSDIDVKQVTAADADQLTCEALNPEHVRAASAAESATRSASAAETRTPPTARKRKSFSAPTRLGRDLRLDLSLEPMWDLQNGLRTVGHFARTILYDGQAGSEMSAHRRAELQPSDLLDLDLATLTEAISLRAGSPRSAGGLLVPVSYKVVSNSNSRYALIHAVQAFGAEAQNSFAWELVDLEPGIPPDRLAEIVALIRPHCRGVICRITPSRNAPDQLRRAGTTGSIAPEGGQPFTDLALRRLAPPLGAIRRTIPAMLLHEVPQDLVAEAIRAGASHCTLPETAPGGFA